MQPRPVQRPSTAFISRHNQPRVGDQRRHRSKTNNRRLIISRSCCPLSCAAPPRLRPVSWEALCVATFCHASYCHRSLLKTFRDGKKWDHSFLSCTGSRLGIITTDRTVDIDGFIWNGFWFTARFRRDTMGCQSFFTPYRRSAVARGVFQTRGYWNESGATVCTNLDYPRDTSYHHPLLLSLFVASCNRRNIATRRSLRNGASVTNETTS